MKRIVIVALMLTAAWSIHAAPLQQNQQRQQKQALRPAVRRSVAEDAVYAFYAKQFQQSVEVTPEVLPKILSFVEQFVHDRFEVTQRRTRALNQLRQAVRNNGSEDDLKRWVRELDAADAEFQANQERFLNNVDPLLTARQQAVVRMIQVMADNRIRQALESVQNPAGQRQNAPAPVSQ